MNATIVWKKEININDISLFQFVDVLNSQGVLKKYFQSQPDVEIEYFSEKEEK